MLGTQRKRAVFSPPLPPCQFDETFHIV
jgi:hypothetical protein